MHLHTSTEVHDTLTLPSLKDGMSRAAPAVRMYRTTSIDDFDEFCKRDDMLFLRLGQGARRHRAGRDAGDDDGRSIGESDYEDSGNMAVKRPYSSRMFPSFSPEPDLMELGPQHCDREEQLGSSQRDVYDVSPPPGYKRLKRVRATALDADAYDNDENITAATAMNQLLFPPESHISRLQHSRRRQIPKQHTRNTRSKYRHDVSSAVLPMGDGFSGDETRPQRKAKAKQRRAKPRAKPAARSVKNVKNVKNERDRQSRNASDSSGSNQSTTLFSNRPLSSVERETRKRRDQPSLLGSLDVVSLSQEDQREAQQAATAALYSAEKSKDIATHVMPLRPMGAAVCKPKFVSLDLDEPGILAEVQEVQEVQEVHDVVRDSQNTGDAVFDVDADAAKMFSLPSLRG